MPISSRVAAGRSSAGGADLLQVSLPGRIQARVGGMVVDHVDLSPGGHASHREQGLGVHQGDPADRSDREIGWLNQRQAFAVQGEVAAHVAVDARGEHRHGLRLQQRGGQQ
jgi:hypothetical protein